MAKEKKKIEFRYYEMPSGEYVLPKLGEGWVQEYGAGMNGMLHFHNYLEIGYCYWGDGELTIEDRVYHYGDEEMISIIPANMPHTTQSKPGGVCKWEFLFIDIEGFINNEIKASKLIKEDMLNAFSSLGTIKTVRNHPELGMIVKTIIEECRLEKKMYRDMVKALLHSFVVSCMRIEKERSEAKKEQHLNEYIERAMEYVQLHYHEEIKMADLANVAGLSESHFRRTFEDIMGMKPNEYLNMIRIKKACDLISKKENISMEEVSIRVGYTTQSTFNRNFKRITQRTPYEWKEEVLKNENVILHFKVSAEKGWEA